MEWQSQRKQQACQRGGDVYNTPRLNATRAYAGYRYKPHRVRWWAVLGKLAIAAVVLVGLWALLVRAAGLL